MATRTRTGIEVLRRGLADTPLTRALARGGSPGVKASPRTLLRSSDGDTPVVDQPVRMVSVDTPEKAGYAGKAETAQPVLDRCRARLESGDLRDAPDELRTHLLERLTPDAAARHIEAGNRAWQVFSRELDDRLTRENGGRRQVGVLPTGEKVDRYGRMLAYLAPWFSGGADPLPARDDPARETFNLVMAANGWAATLLLFPSLPAQDGDLRLLVHAARRAVEEGRGMWSEFGKDLLLPYEYRACVKLGRRSTTTLRSAFSRVCFDVRTGEEVGPYGYAAVPPGDRLWSWPDEVAAARAAVPRVVAAVAGTG